MTDTKAQRLENDITEIKGALKEITRRLDNLDRYVELIYKDRELMNETNENISGLKQRVVDHAEHIENVVKDSQNEMHKDIIKTQDVMEAKVDEVKGDVVKGITGAVTKKKGLLG